MKCSLWLNRQKVNSVEEIIKNPDVASLRGYFLAGSLVEWLEDNNGKEYADRLRELSADTPDLNDRIAEIFGGNANRHKKLTGSTTQKPSVSKKKSDLAVSSYKTPFSGASLKNSSASFDTSALSVYLGSFRWSVGGGSFSWSSFTRSSFQEWEWEWLWNFFKGYSSGSFVSGSFSISSFPTNSFVQQDRMFKLLAEMENANMLDGSFPIWEKLGIDEYDYIMFKTLMMCPLNRFGYGIHIV